MDQSRKRSILEFGLVMATACLLAQFLLFKNAEVQGYLQSSAALFIILSASAPKLISPLERAWMKFGELLSGIMTPILLGVIFLLILSPLALLRRLFNKNSKTTTSTWISEEKTFGMTDIEKPF